MLSLVWAAMWIAGVQGRSASHGLHLKFYTEAPLCWVVFSLLLQNMWQVGEERAHFSWLAGIPHSQEGSGAGAWGGRFYFLMSQESECSAQLLLWFSAGPWLGMVPPPFKLGLFFSVQPLWKKTSYTMFEEYFAHKSKESSKTDCEDYCWVASRALVLVLISWQRFELEAGRRDRVSSHQFLVTWEFQN